MPLHYTGWINRICDLTCRGGDDNDKLICFAKPCHSRLFARTHARRGSMSNRSISLLDVDVSTKYTKSHKYEIYELKPITWYTNAKLNPSGRKQLKGYIDGINTNGFRGEDEVKAVVGKSWNPNNMAIPSPINSRKEIAFYTYYGTQPGMIYYGEREE